MRYWRAIVPAVLLASTMTAAAQAPAGQAPGVEQVVAGRVRGYFAAMGKGDLAVVAQSLAGDYVVIGGDGKLETRAERLAWLRANARDLTTITPREVQVRVYDRTAVVVGLVELRPDANMPLITERFTQVWVHRGKDWRMVSGQITIAKP